MAGVGEFAVQMAVGAVVGALGGLGLARLMRVPLPSDALYPVRVLAVAALIYGVATVLSGSGFLAVLLAGILVGDVRAPYKREIEHVSASVAGLAEIVAFTVLGLTISLPYVLAPGPAVGRTGAGRAADPGGPAGAGRGADPADPVALGRAGVRVVGRVEGGRADPARHLHRARRRS